VNSEPWGPGLLLREVPEPGGAIAGGPWAQFSWREGVLFVLQRLFRLVPSMSTAHHGFIFSFEF
jgi:hypothetical protein